MSYAVCPETEKSASPARNQDEEEAELLYGKARELLNIYEKATGCAALIFDQRGHPVNINAIEKNLMFFCILCRRFETDPKRQWEEGEYPCTRFYQAAIDTARESGGSYVFLCKFGFACWLSPIYAGGRFAGALVAGRLIGIGREKALENILDLCGGKVSASTIQKRLGEIREAGYEEVKANAQLLMVCAKKISRQGGFGKENEAQAISSNETKILWNDLKTGEQARFLENERLLLASLRRGDGEEAGKIFSAIIEILSEAGSGNFEFFKLHAIQLTVLLSREALSNEARTGPGFSSAPEHSRDAEILEANNRYLKKIEESTDMKELTAIVHAILGHMSGMLFSFHGCRHSSALRRAERFIWENYTRKISLQEIADASGLSAPYFSTIFKDEMGENLSNYLNRLRVEKARGMLTETECPLSEVASSCGFEDQSWFSKIFKSYTGISPGKYREKGGGLPAEKNGEQA